MKKMSSNAQKIEEKSEKIRKTIFTLRQTRTENFKRKKLKKENLKKKKIFGN